MMAMPRLSVVLPCRNEAATVALCISKARAAMPDAEIVVVDNASTDGSAAAARKAGARVVHEPIPGYGAALLAGLSAAKGDLIAFCDADGTYDLSELPRLVAYASSADLVLGSRFRGRIQRGAMPALHRYLGNPLLSAAYRLLFGVSVSDSQSGFRLIRRVALKRLSLKAREMDFASEMLIKAARAGLIVREVPISYRPRRSPSKLRSFPDGWKNLRIMLLYSPFYLFLFPGIVLFALGLFLLLLFLPGPMTLFGIKWDIHPMILGSLLALLGYQVILLWFSVKAYQVTHLHERNSFVERLSSLLSLERGLLLGAAVSLCGIIPLAVLLWFWIANGFPALATVRVSIFSLTLVLLGANTIFSSFFLSILGSRLLPGRS